MQTFVLFWGQRDLVCNGRGLHANWEKIQHLQRKALEETKAMIPVLRERITSAREKLESFLVRVISFAPRLSRARRVFDIGGGEC